MLPTILSVISLVVLVAEVWTGFAVVGWSGDRMIVERAKTPGQYWFWMSLHTVAGIGIPVIAFLVT